MNVGKRDGRGRIVALILTVHGMGMGWTQEVLLMPSATQPSVGTFLVRSQLRWYQGGGNDQLMTPFSISGGVAPKHSVGISGAGNFSQSDSGLSDLDLLWKWRFFTKDSGPLDTSRTALLAGLQFPTGSGVWSTGSFNPSMGIAHTQVTGRLGLGFSGIYKLNTGNGAEVDVTGMDGEGSAWTIGSSATWRLKPGTYTSQTKGAMYISVEGAWAGLGEGNSIRIGPSLFYEVTTWVIEVGWQYYPLNTGDMLPFNSMGIVGLRFFF